MPRSISLSLSEPIILELFLLFPFYSGHNHVQLFLCLMHFCGWTNLFTSGTRGARGSLPPGGNLPQIFPHSYGANLTTA